MVIIIGAESMTGKTLMAQKLLETYKIPYMSIDHLKMGLYRANINCGFHPEDPNEKIEKLLWPILKGIIETNIENNQNIIIEGCYIFPCRVNELSNEYKKHIIPVFMGFSKLYLENNFDSGVLEYKSVIEVREYDDERPLEYFIHAHKKMKTMCTESNIQYFEINNDYEHETEKIYRWVDLEIERFKNLV